MPSKVPRLLVIVATAVVMILSAAVPARADATVGVSFGGHLRGIAHFTDYGDWFMICDERKDNLPVAVRFSYIRKNHTRQTGSHWHTQGADGYGNQDRNGNRVRGCSFGNHNFGEGRNVWLQACVRHGSGALTCGKTHRTIA